MTLSELSTGELIRLLPRRNLVGVLSALEHDALAEIAADALRFMSGFNPGTPGAISTVTEIEGVSCGLHESD